MRAFNLTILSILILALSFVQSVTAHAADYWPDVGGFATREDVQVAFGWKAAKLLANIDRISFTYETIDSYIVICVGKNDEGRIEEKTNPVSYSVITDVESAIVIETGKDGGRYLTGFDLKGFKGRGLASGKVPKYGESCPGNNDPKITVSRVELTDTMDRLFVNYGSKKVPIWIFE